MHLDPVSEEDPGYTSAVPRVRYRVSNLASLDKVWAIVRPILALSPLVPFLAILWLIWNRTLAIPWWDDWHLVPFLAAAGAGTLSFAELWAPHNEHRIVVLRVVSLVLSELTGWNLQIQMTVNLMIGVATLLLLLDAARRTFGSTNAAVVLAVPFALLVLSLTQYESWLMASQIAYIATVFGVSLSAWALLTRTSWAALGLALVGALIACMSSGAGMTVWLAFLPAVWRLGYRKIVVWVLVGLGVMVPYLVGLGSQSARGSKLVDIVSYVLAYLGAPVGYGNMLASSGVMVASTIVLLAALLALWRLHEELGPITVWLGLAAFAFGCAALTAVGRPPSMGGFAFPSRYNSFAAFWWVAVITITALTAVRLAQINPQSITGQVARTRLILAGAIAEALVLLFIGLVIANGSAFRDGLKWLDFQRRHQDCVLAYRYVADDCLSLYLWNPAFVRAQLQYLDERHWTIFRDFAAINVDRLAPASQQGLGLIETLDGRAINVPSADEVTAAPAHRWAAWPWWISRAKTEGQGRTHRARMLADLAIPIHGWAVDPTTNGPAGGVLITIDDKTHVWTEYGTSRPDVAAAHQQPAYESTGFSANIPGEALPPGRHRLTLKVLTPDRRAYTVPPQIVEVRVQAGSPVDPTQLTRLDKSTWGDIGTVNGVSWPLPRVRPLALPVDQSIQVKGWAVDARENRLAHGAFLAVDDKWYFPVKLGLARFDVADLLENRAFALSGYEAVIPAGALPPGRHVMTLRVLARDERSYYAPTLEQTIEIELQQGP
jgi:hypothetical protein